MYDVSVRPHVPVLIPGGYLSLNALELMDPAFSIKFNDSPGPLIPFETRFSMRIESPIPDLLFIYQSYQLTRTLSS